MPCPWCLGINDIELVADTLAIEGEIRRYSTASSEDFITLVEFMSEEGDPTVTDQPVEED